MESSRAGTEGRHRVHRSRACPGRLGVPRGTTGRPQQLGNIWHPYHIPPSPPTPSSSILVVTSIATSLYTSLYRLNATRDVFRKGRASLLDHLSTDPQHQVPEEQKPFRSTDWASAREETY
ncbi:unnamed protein product [Pleuronectes platessa]|uniref:Uncharacterized protein n=1 Tax=Pleuronectes platessa TaxID=8262 RepID=A0A9N7TWJ3_PLEPL|nr:unnamed protein product [Pleuronectes platessa]